MNRLPEIVYPRHPAHIDPYVAVLGPRLALCFLLEFGGTPSLYFPNDPKGKSAAEHLIGPERLRALGQRFASQRVEVPRPRTWIIHALKAEGATVSEICRVAGCTRPTVAKALKLPPHGGSLIGHAEPALDDRQMRLF